MEKQPFISVIMPVYNAEKYLKEAIDSILAQTVKDYELLIIDDGSTDHTIEIVKEYILKDSRVVLLQNEQNLGVSKTLNRGLEAARGKYIARMDADDIALPTRFHKQLEYMEHHENVAILSCGLQCFGANNAVLGTTVGVDKVKVSLLFNSCLGHPGYMMRGDILRKYHLCYNEANQYAEDYELLCDTLAYGEIDNYPEILMRYRVHEKSVSREHRDIQRESTNKVRGKMLQKLGIQLTQDEIVMYGKAANPKPYMSYSVQEYKSLVNLYHIIEKANEEKDIFDSKELHRQLQERAMLYKKEIALVKIWKKRIKSWLKMK